MKKYVRPDVFVTEFQPSVAVAACEREWNGKVDTSWAAQAITCNRQGSTTDYIFAQNATGCQYVPCHMVYIADGGTYTAAELNGKGLGIVGVDSGSGNGKGNGNSSGTVTVPAGGGWVLCWEEGNHYGNATPDIVKLMTSSF